MKRLMLIGGIIGFLTALCIGLNTEGADWQGILFRAAIASLAGGILFRWWGRSWVAVLREVHNQQLTAMIKAQEANGPKTPWRR